MPARCYTLTSSLLLLLLLTINPFCNCFTFVKQKVPFEYVCGQFITAAADAVDNDYDGSVINFSYIYMYI